MASPSSDSLNCPSEEFCASCGSIRCRSAFAIVYPSQPRGHALDQPDAGPPSALVSEAQKPSIAQFSQTFVLLNFISLIKLYLEIKCVKK